MARGRVVLPRMRIRHRAAHGRLGPRVHPVPSRAFSAHGSRCDRRGHERGPPAPAARCERPVAWGDVLVLRGLRRGGRIGGIGDPSRAGRRGRCARARRALHRIARPGPIRARSCSDTTPPSSTRQRSGPTARRLSEARWFTREEIGRGLAGELDVRIPGGISVAHRLIRTWVTTRRRIPRRDALDSLDAEQRRAAEIVRSVAVLPARTPARRASLTRTASRTASRRARTRRTARWR